MKQTFYFFCSILYHKLTGKCKYFLIHWCVGKKETGNQASIYLQAPRRIQCLELVSFVISVLQWFLTVFSIHLIPFLLCETYYSLLFYLLFKSTCKLIHNEACFFLFEDLYYKFLNNFRTLDLRSWDLYCLYRNFQKQVFQSRFKMHYWATNEFVT